MHTHILRLWLKTVAVLMIASCGFHLHDNAQISRQMNMLIIDAPDIYSPLIFAIREQLRLHNISVVNDARRKDLPLLRIINTDQSQNTISIFQNGKTAEYQIILTVQAQVLFPSHTLHPLSISVIRFFLDNPINALAKDSEREIIRQEMTNQIAQQLVRKLLKVQVVEQKNPRKITTVNTK
ncbi:LPS assembly lipoprotein LptE [Candidatus Gillettellia adelgis]